MCLGRLYNRSDIKKLPTEFVAFKVVRKKGGKYFFPVFNTTKQIERNNIASKLSSCASIDYKNGGYKPYYHSFKTQRACDTAAKEFSGLYKFIKIKIKRRHVTRIGNYGPLGCPKYKVIVSREFTTDFEEYIPNVPPI